MMSSSATISSTCTPSQAGLMPSRCSRRTNPKDLSSWNSMIQAYGIHGDGHSALRAFNQLKRQHKHTPNAITFVSVISACSHSGLMKEGYQCFETMQREIEPTMEHYASIVDLMGRSGKLEEAENFIEQMPVEPSSK